MAAHPGQGGEQSGFTRPIAADKSGNAPLLQPEGEVLQTGLLFPGVKQRQTLRFRRRLRQPGHRGRSPPVEPAVVQKQAPAGERLPAGLQLRRRERPCIQISFVLHQHHTGQEAPPPVGPVVHHQQGQAPPVERLELGGELGAGGRVQVGEGLVQDEQPCAGGQRGAQGQLLLGAAGQGANGGLGQLPQARQLQQLVHPGPQVAGVVDVLQGEEHLMVHSVHAELVVRILEEDGDRPGPGRRPIGLQRPSRQPDRPRQLAGILGVEPRQTVGQGGLAAAGGPHQQHRLSLLHRQRQVGKDGSRLLPIAEGQFPADQQRLRHGPGPGRSP